MADRVPWGLWPSVPHCRKLQVLIYGILGMERSEVLLASVSGRPQLGFGYLVQRGF